MSVYKVIFKTAEKMNNQYKEIEMVNIHDKMSNKRLKLSPQGEKHFWEETGIDYLKKHMVQKDDEKLIKLANSDTILKNDYRAYNLGKQTYHLFFENEYLKLDIVNAFIDLVTMWIKNGTKCSNEVFVKKFVFGVFNQMFMEEENFIIGEMIINSKCLQPEHVTILIQELEESRHHVDFYKIFREYIDFTKPMANGLTYLNEAVIDANHELIRVMMECGCEKESKLSKFNNSFHICQQIKHLNFKSFKLIASNFFLNNHDKLIHEIRYAIYNYVVENNLAKVSKLLTTYGMSANFLSFCNVPIVCHSPTIEMAMLLAKFGGCKNMSAIDIRGDMLILSDKAIIKFLLNKGVDPTLALDFIKKRLESGASYDTTMALEEKRTLIISLQQEMKQKLRNKVKVDKDILLYKDIFDIVLDYM